MSEPKVDRLPCSGCGVQCPLSNEAVAQCRANRSLPLCTSCKRIPHLPHSITFAAVVARVLGDDASAYGLSMLETPQEVAARLEEVRQLVTPEEVQASVASILLDSGNKTIGEVGTNNRAYLEALADKSVQATKRIRLAANEWLHPTAERWKQVARKPDQAPASKPASKPKQAPKAKGTAAQPKGKPDPADELRRRLSDREAELRAAQAELDRVAEERKRPDESPQVVELRLDVLRYDGDTQSRERIDEKTIDEYVEAMLRGDELPPADVVFDGKDYWLIDGWHRARARSKAGYQTILCREQNGTLADAQWLCLAANQRHGLKRSTDDKERAIRLAVKARPDLCDSAIAAHLGVSPKTVGKHRRNPDAPDTDAADQTPTMENPKSPVIRTDRRGRKINTTNIGRKKVTGVTVTTTGPWPKPPASAEPTEPADTTEPAVPLEVPKVPSETPEEHEQRLKVEAQADARSSWLKGFADALHWFETFLKGRTDEDLAWFTQPGSPGLLNHGITRDRIEAVRDSLGRAGSCAFAGQGKDTLEQGPAEGS